MLIKGTLNHLIEASLSTNEPFKMEDIDRTLPVCVDTNFKNAGNRRRLYFKQQDICMKLAVEVPEKLEEFTRFSRKPQEAIMNGFLYWNLRTSLNEEMMPADILRCLKITRSDFGEDSVYLPRLVRYMRFKTHIYLEQEFQPYCLSDLLPNRPLMNEIGPRIVTNLLKGLLYLQKKGLVLGNI